MTIPARRDPAAEALQLAAYRMSQCIYRGFRLSYAPNCNGLDWSYVDDDDDENPARQGLAPTHFAARRAVDELLSKETMV